MFTENSTINISGTSQPTGNSTGIPDYDYEIVLSPPLAELIPVSIAYGLTLILGLVGNGLVIFSVSRYQQMKSITNTFLLSLATADLLLVLICVPVKVSDCLLAFILLFRKRQILDSSKLKELADDIFKFDENGRKFVQTGTKHCGKTTNCSLRGISPFPTVFSKGLFSRGLKRCHCVGMG